MEGIAQQSTSTKVSGPSIAEVTPELFIGSLAAAKNHGKSALEDAGNDGLTTEKRPVEVAWHYTHMFVHRGR